MGGGDQKGEYLPWDCLTSWVDVMYGEGNTYPGVRVVGVGDAWRHA